MSSTRVDLQGILQQLTTSWWEWWPRSGEEQYRRNSSSCLIAESDVSCRAMYMYDIVSGIPNFKSPKTRKGSAIKFLIASKPREVARQRGNMNWASHHLVSLRSDHPPWVVTIIQKRSSKPSPARSTVAKRNQSTLGTARHPEVQLVQYQWSFKTQHGRYCHTACISSLQPHHWRDLEAKMSTNCFLPLYPPRDSARCAEHLRHILPN